MVVAMKDLSMLVAMKGLLWLTLLLVETMEVSSVEVVSYTGDVTAVAGDRVRMECGTERSRRNGFSNCSWGGPDRERHFAGDGGEDRVNVYVERDDDHHLCVLEIDSVEETDAGAWNCLIRDRGKDVGKYMFISLMSEQGLHILLEDGLEVRGRRGRRLEMVCPTNVRPSTEKERPRCIWYSPEGRKFDIVGRHGETYVHEEDGIFEAGDVDRGDCGVEIRDLERRHEGIWTCRIFSKTSSDILEKNISVSVDRGEEVERQKLAVVQDKDVTFTVNFSRSRDEQIFSIYWILRREYIVEEGRDMCFKARNRQCVVSSDSKVVEEQGDVDKYEIDITYEEIAKEDVDDPIALVVEWRDVDGTDKSEVKMVEGVGRVGRFVTAALADDEGCSVEGEKMQDGASRVLDKLCVRVTCDKGDVQIRKDTSNRRCR